jgi:hypothetical protein
MISIFFFMQNNYYIIKFEQKKIYEKKLRHCMMHEYITFIAVISCYNVHVNYVYLL